MTLKERRRVRGRLALSASQTTRGVKTLSKLIALTLMDPRPAQYPPQGMTCPLGSDLYRGNPPMAVETPRKYEDTALTQEEDILGVNGVYSGISLSPIQNDHLLRL